MNLIAYAFPALVTWAVTVFYFWMAYQVGKARTRTGVKPPLMDGPEEFLRYFRAHQNMGEQLIVFLPLLWLFAMFQSPTWAGILGILWFVGRVIYTFSYWKDAEKRMPGFIISLIITLALMIGSLIGIIGALTISA